jgi:DNA-binding NtrC family response regulator
LSDLYLTFVESGPTSGAFYEAAEHVEARIESQEANSTKIIFVINDEKVIADTLTIILRQQGYDAYAFMSAKEAVGVITDRRPDLIICDVVMSDMTAVDLAIHARRLAPQCTLLLFSGHAGTDEILLQADSAGVQFEIISKPIHPSVLIAKLESLI